MSNNVPCPVCLNAGVSHEEASRHTAQSDNPKYQRNGKQVAVCFRINKHPHGGRVEFYRETGELVKKVGMSSMEWLMQNGARPDKVWGVNPESLSSWGIRKLTPDLADKFRDKFTNYGKKLPPYKVLADAERNDDPILTIPYFNEKLLCGIEVRIDRPKGSMRPGDSNRSSGGKSITFIGNQGVFVPNPYPKVVPSVVVVLEGPKAVCAAAEDAKADGWDAPAFVGVNANFKPDILRNTIAAFFPGIPIIAISDRDPAGVDYTKKMIRMGAIESSLSGCSGNDYADEPDRCLRLQSMQQAVSDGMAEWNRRRDTRGGDDNVMKVLRDEGLAFTDDSGNLQLAKRIIVLERVLQLDRDYGCKLRRNEMELIDYIGDKPITDATITQIQNDLDRKYHLTASVEAIERQIALICSSNKFHPIREYFKQLPSWDGEDRYPKILEEVIGARHDELNIAMLKCFFIGAVARVEDPGCKLDTVLILKSAQGTGKTTFFRNLVPDVPGAFLEGHEDIVSKDGLLAVHRSFITEFGEIDRITRSKDPEVLKNFITRQTDCIRPPYARRPLDMRRSFVAVGTTNQDGLLVDTSGHRRFHVIETGDTRYNLDLISRYRDQIWAQALSDYDSGENWWLSRDMERLHKRKMGEFEPDDPMSDLVEKVLNGFTGQSRVNGISISEILTKLDVRPEQQSRALGNRVTQMLKKSGWKTDGKQRRMGGLRIRLWFPPTPDHGMDLFGE